MTNLFSDTAGQRSRTNGNNQRGNGGGSASRRSRRDCRRQTQQSDRSLLQAKVVAVGDPRTNSLVVTAANDSMLQIESVVKKLDATRPKNSTSISFPKHADADTAPAFSADVERRQFRQYRQQPVQNTRLGQRQLDGASSDTTLNSSSVGSGSGNSGGRSLR